MMPDKTRIFWEGYGLANPFSGIGTHAFRLQNELRNMGSDPQILTSWVQNKVLSPLLSQKKILKIPTVGHESRVLHALSNINLPLFRSCKIRTVLTVHDLIPLLYPNLVSFTYRTQFAWLLPKAVAHADKIICVSEWTKRSLLSFCKIPESKITVIPNGIDKPAANLPRKNSNQQIRVLTVSRFEPYKRLDQILEILKISKDRVRFIVVTDARGENFFQKNVRLEIKTQLTREKIFDLYKNSDVYLHPSLCEGFCLPAAEAQALGVPVVYQAGTGTDEVVGAKTGRGLAPEATAQEWFEAIVEMHAESQKPEFLENIQSHLSLKNTWKDSAKAVKSIYDQLLT